MCPVIIELEVNPLAEQYLDTKDGSTTWSLEDAQVKVDLVTMQPDPIYNTITTSGLEIGLLTFNTTLNMVPGLSDKGGVI